MGHVLMLDVGLLLRSSCQEHFVAPAFRRYALCTPLPAAAEIFGKTIATGRVQCCRNQLLARSAARKQSSEAMGVWNLTGTKLVMAPLRSRSKWSA